MKLKMKKHKGEWFSGIYCGRGGISSMVISRQGRFWFCLAIFFMPKELWVGLTGKASGYDIWPFNHIK